jgi:hypothetical protein
MNSFITQQNLLQATDAFQALITGPMCSAIMAYASISHPTGYLQRQLFFLPQHIAPGQSSALYLMLQRCVAK